MKIACPNYCYYMWWKTKKFVICPVIHDDIPTTVDQQQLEKYAKEGLNLKISFLIQKSNGFNLQRTEKQKKNFSNSFLS